MKIETRCARACTDIALFTHFKIFYASRICNCCVIRLILTLQHYNNTCSYVLRFILCDRQTHKHTSIAHTLQTAFCYILLRVFQISRTCKTQREIALYCCISQPQISARRAFLRIRDRASCRCTARQDHRMHGAFYFHVLIGELTLFMHSWYVISTNAVHNMCKCCALCMYALWARALSAYVRSAQHLHSSSTECINALAVQYLFLDWCKPGEPINILCVPFSALASGNCAGYFNEPIN